MAIRVALVDDHQLVRKGIRALLRRIEDVEVVAEASNGEAAVEMARQHKPDVILMDVVLPKLGGIPATRRICEEVPGCRIIGLSGYIDRDYSDEIRRAGGVGYVSKTCASEELARAIRIVAAGNEYFAPPEGSFSDPSEVNAAIAAATPSAANLTQRERQVLTLLTNGLRPRQIADVLHLSVKTVESHRRNVMHKLQIFSLVGLTKFAIREGLTEPDS